MSARRLGGLGVRVIRAPARFTDRSTLRADTVLIGARRFVLCTGATPAIPAVPGIDRVPVLTARTVLELDELPKRLLVLGAGSTGLELAQLFRRLGSKVAVLDGGAALRDVDPELAAPLLKRLGAEGIRIRQRVTALRVEPDGAGVRLVFRDATNEAVPEYAETGSHLLVAAGWLPNVADLGLEAAEIRCEPRGIAVEPNGRTSNHRVFAIGDVVGLGRSAQSAQAQAEVVLRAALFRQPVRFDPRMVPRVLRTDPEIAAVGLSEAQAREHVGRIRVLRAPYGENARARAEGRTSGHAKVVTARNGRVLGAGIVGARASETIGLWTLAVARGLKAEDIAALPLPHPSYAEVSRRAAASAMALDLGSRWVRRALRLVRMLG